VFYLSSAQEPSVILNMPQLNFSTFFVVFFVIILGFFIFKWSSSDVSGLK